MATMCIYYCTSSLYVYTKKTTINILHLRVTDSLSINDFPNFHPLFISYLKFKEVKGDHMLQYENVEASFTTSHEQMTRHRPRPIYDRLLL